MSSIYQQFLVKPLFNVLVYFTQLTGSFGIGVILLTLLSRFVLLPIFINSTNSAKKMQEIKPELEKLKNKYKYDKKLLGEKQMALYKDNGINPASGCLVQIPMFAILFALFSVIRQFANATTIETINDLIYSTNLKFVSLEDINTHFLGWNLFVTDSTYILPILSGLLQFVASKMMQPYIIGAEQSAKKTPQKSDDFAYNMQEQMLYILPLMTVVIGTKLPAGFVLYMLVGTLFQIFQTYFVSGLGGLTPYIERLKKYELIRRITRNS
ncbi:MAG: YidC/Oxa1 family membrane protein insertase [Patescibacteria group bacterium]